MGQLGLIVVAVVIVIAVIATYPILLAIIIPAIGLGIWYVRKTRIDKVKEEKQSTLIAETKAKEKANLDAERKNLYKENRINKFTGLMDTIQRTEITQNTAAKHEKFNVKSFYVDVNPLRANTPLNRLLDFVVIDVETTGLTANLNSIVQVTAIRFEDFQPTEMFSTYINPTKPIPEDAIKIHGITDEMVKDAPVFDWVIDSLDEFIGKSNLVGHNLTFDLKFLYKNGYDFLKHKRMLFDTLEISKSIDKDAYSRKLTDLCKDNSILFPDAHSSEPDALAAGLLFLMYIRDKIDIDYKQYPHILDHWR